MGTKYIVELEDGEHLYKTTINALGNPVMRSAEKVPYTEFDLRRGLAREQADIDCFMEENLAEAACGGLGKYFE